MNTLSKEKRMKKIGILLLAFLLLFAAVLMPTGPGKPKVYAASNGYFLGIDVSDHNGNINWSAAKAGGIEFAIIRIGWGNDLNFQDDAKAVRNMQECERLGIPYGVYIYSYALTKAEVKSEAAHTIRMIRGHNPSLGVWFDMEDADSYKEKNYFSPYTHGAQLTQFCLDYISYMKQAGYSTVGVYANPDYFRNVLNYNKIRAAGLIWIAHWGVNSPAYEGAVWQYSADGKVNGNSGVFDMNRVYQGSPLYQIIGKAMGPADYSGYNKAIKAVPANLSEYTAESVANLNAVIKKIPKDYVAKQQSQLDAQVQEIYRAIAYLECAHRKMSHVEAIEPTCTEPGREEYWSCGFCGKRYWDSAGANEILTKDTAISALGHRWSRWDVKQLPTEEAEGYMERTCSRCGAVETKPIQPGMSRMRGDVNGDGEITSADLTELAKYVAQIKEIPDADTYMAADVDQNGIVDAADMTHLAKFIANIIPEL